MQKYETIVITLSDLNFVLFTTSFDIMHYEIKLLTTYRSSNTFQRIDSKTAKKSYDEYETNLR